MTKSSAANVIGEYANAHNIRYKDGDTALVGNTKLLDVGFFPGNQALKYQIGKEYFGADNLQDKGFLDKFMREYNIPEFTPMPFKDLFGNSGEKYVYTNTNDKYSINVFPNDILVEAIRK